MDRDKLFRYGRHWVVYWGFPLDGWKIADGHYCELLASLMQQLRDDLLCEFLLSSSCTVEFGHKIAAG